MNTDILDKILPLVQRPARYINHEINSHKPDMSQDISVCLCFPDIYEVGGSNLGLEILYHMVNEKKAARCERAYAPDIDLEQILINNKQKLFSLESKTPLDKFDIVGFSIQCELVATNIVNMLSLSDIPVFAKDRKDGDTLIVGGGPCTANPEPVADFFDLFIIGDGEESLLKVIEIYRSCKNKKLSRKEILFELSKTEGVYVPSFYDVCYNDDGTVKNILPNREGISEIINKTIVKDLDKAFFHKNKTVPFVSTVHNRLNIEVARGCIGRCRFCQASKYYRPWRSRKPETVMNLVDDGLKSTGYEEVAFSSLSCTDYKDLEKLLYETNTKYSKQNLSISLPSMRCSTFSLKVAEYINRDKKPTITFAPEAGSDRLRNVIGKYLTENEIINTLTAAYRMGWRTVKLYFMIGLPTETLDDILAIKELIKKIKTTASKLNFSITVSPFVPKAQTAFQWNPMASQEYIKDTIKFIYDNIPADIRAHNSTASLLEAFFARGDRRQSAVIYSAWKNGARFDQWADRFNFDLWKNAISESGLDLGFYVFRQRKEDEILPWEHINLGLDKKWLYNDYLKGISETENSDICIPVKTASLPDNTSSFVRQYSEAKYRVLLKFARSGYLKYLSHLEQIDFLRRALKRTSLPLAYTNGFSPQIKSAFGPAISVGYESDCEYMDLYLTEKTDIKTITDEISSVLPDGYRLVSVKNTALKLPAIDRMVNVAEYNVRCDISQKDIDVFLAKDEILIEKIKKEKKTVVDAKELIRSIKKISEDTVQIFLRFGDGKNIKLEKILQNLLNIEENKVKILYTKRMNLFVEKNGMLYEI